MMPEQTDLNALRAAILRFFLEDGARQVADFLAASPAQSHRPRFVRDLIISMAQAGLLDRFGRTSGVYFQTSHLGFVVLATLAREPSPSKAAAGLPEAVS